MTRWLVLVMVTVALLSTVFFGGVTASAVAQQDEEVPQIFSEELPSQERPRCVRNVPSEQVEGISYAILTVNPALANVRVEIDGILHSSDIDGCIVVELPVGPHTFVVPTDEDGEPYQLLQGKIRPVAADFERVEIVTQTPIRRTIEVREPVCSLRPAVTTPELRPSFGAATGKLAISTVPRTEGALVNIDGHDVFSDADGCLVLELELGMYEIVVPELYEYSNSTRYVFGRWDDIWANERQVRVRAGTERLQLGIKIQHPTRFEFLDGSGEPFDRSKVQTARLVNSFGEEFPLSEQALDDDDAVSFDEVWLTRNRLRRISAGLFSDDNIYVFREVIVDGQNVIQSGEIDYIPSLNPNCPRLSIDEPQRCLTWRAGLLLFPFQVELRSFIFRSPVDANVDVFLLDGPETDEPAFSGATNDEGWVIWPQVPRGDYEIRVDIGAITTNSPTIVTGPKVERITVMTGDVLWFVIPTLILMLMTVILFVVKPRWRLALAALWPLVIGFVLSVPTLGAAFTRPLSASVRPIYTAEGSFVGLDATVRNKSVVPIEQAYCAPDFELRVPTDAGIWRATYESPDFHDVETSPFCRIHNVDPGSNRHYFSSTDEQEWFLDGDLPEPGIYEAFVRIFDVPAGAIDLDLREGLAPYLTFGEREVFQEEGIFFTNPFED